MTWTANTDGFAMSEYPDCSWREPIEIDGHLYAVTDNGLAAIDAADDEGCAFGAAIEWGLLLLDTPALKRPAYAYIGYASDDVLRFTLWHSQNGEMTDAVYDLPYRLADDPEPGRFRLGRGIRSRYLRPGFVSDPGVSFEIFDASIVYDATGRRV